MNWFEFFKVSLDFIEKIVGSLAWPVVAVIIAVMFKEKLTKLLDDVSEWKGLGIEAKFARGVEKALEEVEVIEASQPEQAPLPIPDEPEDQPSPDDAELPPIRPINLLLAQTNPKAAILVGRANLESAVQRLLKSTTSDFVQRSLVVNLDALLRANVITKQEFEMANDLRKLGNEASHGDFEPRQTSAINFARAVNKLVAILLSKARK